MQSARSANRTRRAQSTLDNGDAKFNERSLALDVLQLEHEMEGLRLEKLHKVEHAFVLTLRWTCLQCGWQFVVDAPGFAGDGHYHYRDGNTPCGPIVAQRVGGLSAH